MKESRAKPAGRADTWPQLLLETGGLAGTIRAGTPIVPANDPGPCPGRATGAFAVHRPMSAPPSSAFDAVAIGKGSDGFGVFLIHAVAHRTEALGTYAGLSEALDLRDALARLWGLPAVEIAADGSVTGEARRYGRLVGKAAHARRNGSRRRNRPRFLVRRKPGTAISATPVSGRELIARR